MNVQMSVCWCEGGERGKKWERRTHRTHRFLDSTDALSSAVVSSGKSARERLSRIRMAVLDLEKSRRRHREERHGSAPGRWCVSHFSGVSTAENNTKEPRVSIKDRRDHESSPQGGRGSRQRSSPSSFRRRSRVLFSQSCNNSRTRLDRAVPQYQTSMLRTESRSEKSGMKRYVAVETCVVVGRSRGRALVCFNQFSFILPTVAIRNYEENSHRVYSPSNRCEILDSASGN